MKFLYPFLLLYLFTITISAMEDPEDPNGEGARQFPIEDVERPADLLEYSEVSEEEQAAAQKRVEENMAAMVEVESMDDVPIEIFFQDRGLLRKAFMQTGYCLKQVSGAAAWCVAQIVGYAPLSLKHRLSLSAVCMGAEEVVKGDRSNFPDISLEYVFQVFEADPDRATFSTYSLRKRSFVFTGEGFNGVSHGYLGVAVIKDFAYGYRPHLGDESKVLSSYVEDKGKTRLDVLISVRERCSLLEWLTARFVRNDSMILRKLGEPYKDVYGNTCLLYELVADPEGLIIELMRKPKQEFEFLVETWQTQWKKNHGV